MSVSFGIGGKNAQENAIFADYLQLYSQVRQGFVYARENVIFANNPRLLVARVATSLSLSYGIAHEIVLFGCNFVKGLARRYAQRAV